MCSLGTLKCKSISRNLLNVRSDQHSKAYAVHTSSACFCARLLHFPRSRPLSDTAVRRQALALGPPHGPVLPPRCVGGRAAQDGAVWENPPRGPPWRQQSPARQPARAAARPRRRLSGTAPAAVRSRHRTGSRAERAKTPAARGVRWKSLRGVRKRSLLPALLERGHRLLWLGLEKLPEDVAGASGVITSWELNWGGKKGKDSRGRILS